MTAIKMDNAGLDLYSLLGSLPESFSRLKVKWINQEIPELYELGRIELDELQLSMFGVKYLHKNFLLDGMASETGYIANILCLIRKDSEFQRSFVLAQRKGPVYSPEDYYLEGAVGVSKVKPIVDFCGTHLPNWKSSEAYWPLHDGKPMRFFGQIDIPYSSQIEQIPFAGSSLFFFSSADRKVIKATRQELKLQTLRGHYAQEQKRLKKGG